MYKIILQGVFNVDKEKGLTLVEIAEGVTVEDILMTTACNFEVMYFVVRIFITVFLLSLCICYIIL